MDVECWLSALLLQEKLLGFKNETT